MSISNLFNSRSLEGVLKRARSKLGAGELDAAARLVDTGLEKYPEAEALRELRLTIRRVQARSGMQELRSRIAHSRDPIAFEQLVKLYVETDMRDEAKRTALSFAAACPESSAPYLLLGELALSAYVEDVQARDGHEAHEHLRRAARIDNQSMRAHLLLAELYFLVDAKRALAATGRNLEQLDPDDSEVLPVLELIAQHGDAGSTESFDGILARLELAGELAQDPASWPLRTQRNRSARMVEKRTVQAVKQLVRDGAADEILVLRRGNERLVHARLMDSESKRRRVELSDEETDGHLGTTTSEVAQTIATQARELDMGAFRHCVIEGDFGRIVVGSVGDVFVGASRPTRGGDGMRVWDRIAVQLAQATEEVSE